MAQGIQAVLGVGGEWLNDLSKVCLSLFYALIFAFAYMMEMQMFL
jgi:3-oxoacyl-[acyl-carrier-protein] synthase III